MSNMLVNSPIPGVDTYAQAANSAKLAYQKAQAQIGNNRQTLLHNYGYTAQFDPTSGQMSGLTVDPNNQFGQLQSTLHNEANDAYNTYADEVGRGLIGGLAHQATNAVHYSYGAQKQQLGLNLMSDLQGQQGAWDNATTAYNNALWQAEQAQLLAALQAQMWDTPDYSGIDMPDYGDDTPYTPDPQVPSNPSFVNTAGALTPGAKTIPQSALHKIVQQATAHAQPISEHGAGQMVSSTTVKSSTPPQPKKTTPAKVVNNAYNNNKNKRG